MIKRSFLLLTAGLLTVASAQAQLAHRYDLNTNGNDQPGAGFAAANGTLNGGAAFLNNALVTNGGGNINNNTDYLGLPSGVGTGITGNFSIQLYATLGTGGTAPFSSLFSFSSGADANSGRANFLLLNPNRGNNNNNTTVDFRQPTLSSGVNEFNYGPAAQLLAGNAQHNLVLTYNSTTGVSNLYSDGTLAATGTPGTGFSFQTATSTALGQFNGIGGNGPYQDPSFSGTINDFRIYAQTLTQAQVTTLNGLGPDASGAAIAAAIPEPSAWTAALAGVATLVGFQRFRRRAQA